MNSEEKLFLKVDNVLSSNEKISQLSSWELDFLRSVNSIFRRANPRQTKGVSPKQKSIIFKILQSHNLAE